MLGTTLTLPHADGDIVVTKINQDGYGSEYMFRNSTGQMRVKVRHSERKATAQTAAIDRHNVEITQTVFGVDDAADLQRKVYIVIEQEPSDTDIKLVDALCDWLIATAGANITSLLNWSS